MEYSFDVKMKPKHMVQFLLRHSYFRVSGIIGVGVSLVAFVYLVVCWGDLGNQERIIMGILASLFTIINPLMLCNRGKKQVENNECYQQPITYGLTEEGITTTQGENSVVTPWNNLKRIVSMREQLVVYTSPVHAFLFPYESMGENREAIVAYIKEHIA